MIKTVSQPKINQVQNRQVKSDEQYVPTKFKKVASAMESQFAEFMLQQMQKTVNRNTADDSSSKYYKSLMNTERAKTLANQNGGLGIQKMILEQIYPKRYRNEIAFNHYEKMSNPHAKKANQVEMSKPNSNNTNRPVSANDGINAYRKEATNE
jgi:Rod binding domain-containing protein